MIGLENETRCRRLIQDARETFRLDLSGKTVLTETAAGCSVLPPLIAALADCPRVYVLSQDSPFGRADEAIAATLSLAEQWGVAEQIVPLNSRSDDAVGDADIVMHGGFVRPLDVEFLARLKPTAAIPLMGESWEHQPANLDLSSCHRFGLAVLRTNEHSEELQTVGYIGHMALKFLYEAGMEVFRSRVVVFGSGEFARATVATLAAAGADVDRMFCHHDNRPLSYPDEIVLKHTEAVVVVETHHDRLLLGDGGAVDPHWLSERNPGLIVVPLCGNVDRSALRNVGIRCAPKPLASAGSLSVPIDCLGPKPLVDRQTARLRIGQLLSEARRSGLSRFEAEDAVLNRCQFAHRFASDPPDIENTRTSADSRRAA